MSSLTNSKNLSESKTQQHPKETTTTGNQREQQEAQGLKEEKSNAVRDYTRETSETANKSNTIIPAQTLTPIRIGDNKSRNLEIAGDYNLNQHANFSISVTQQLPVNVACGYKMPPGDIEQQMDTSQSTQLIQTKKGNQQQQELQLKLSSDSRIATTLSRPGDCDDYMPHSCYETVGVPTSSALSTITASSSPFQPLPSVLSSSFGVQLPHISSEPTFGVQMRKKQLEQNNDKNEAVDNCEAFYSSCGKSGVKAGTVSESASPNMARKSSESSVVLPRRVSFPKSDNELVTGYLEPANPWVHVSMVKSISEIAELYMISCQKHNTKPLQCVLDHLKAVDLTKQLRQPVLSLKSIELAPSDCEALEEVLKRVQYKSIDLSDCRLNEVAASALFEMIEYYEATNELDISSNSQGMTHRGWLSCTYMISHSQELQVLNAHGNPITKLSADHLGNALNTSNLHTLKLEHCNLKGAPLSGLCFKLWHNRVLKELWIAYNELDSNDADTIAEMLKVNHYLELIDISNNNIGDDGLRHIVLSLIMQSKELERRTTFQRAAAIDDDESMSPFESSAPVDFCDSKDDVIVEPSPEWKETEENNTKLIKESDPTDSRVVKCKKPLSTIEEKSKSNSDTIEPGSAQVSAVSEGPKPIMSSKPPLISTVGTTIEEIDPDEDSDETVRLSSLKNGSTGGQSMLDKLLSMNSESSSEDGVSNLSTDTLAACCSEDASLISDDIFDVVATATTTITIASSNVKSPTTGDRDGATDTVYAISNPMITSSITRSPLHCSPLREEREGEFVVDNNCATTLTEAVNSGLIEHPTIVTSSTTSPTQQSSNSTCHANNSASNNNRNSYIDNNNVSTSSQHIGSAVVYELKADERNCLLGVGGASGAAGSGEVREHVDHTNVLPHLAASKALDVNKNTKLGEDFDDTHSTDSAFESASEGDISRHLPEEFTRLSASLESTRLDDIAKEFSIETATIASESNECLIAADAHVTPSSTPTPQIMPFTQIKTLITERDRLAAETPFTTTTTALDATTSPTKQVGFNVTEGPTDDEVSDKIPKVTIAQCSIAQKYKTNSVVSISPSQTPPPPSTSPGGVSNGLRRTESTCAFLTQSTRNRSQSTDSLCSDNSLDGSIGSGDLNFSAAAQLNEKVTKNDTLTRQQRQQECAAENSVRTPGGLKALALWNNNLSMEAGLYISNLLAETVSLELLNIGKNCLANEFVASIKDSLTKNTTLTTLGLQSAQLSAEGIETLTSIITFGGNSTLQRIDIRGNKVDVDSLTKIAEVLKSNTTVTQIDIDDEPKRLSVGSEAHLDYARILENVRSMCARNEKSQAQLLLEKTSSNPLGKRRGGYYLGSRKISLTCHSRPIVDSSNPVLVTCSAPANSKLDVKRKPGARLRSPVPSPTTISPSSSPNRASRFQVFRVSEVSPLTSPNIQKHMSGLAGTKAKSSSSVFIQSVSSDGGNVETVYPNITSTSLPTSSSLPSMATISSSTQSIKRLSVSPRSRFLVKKIYEDPSVPLASRTVPPITPPINPPPTPISRNSKDSTTKTFLDATSPTLTRSLEHREESADVTRAPFNAPIIVTPSTITSCFLSSSPSKSLTQQQTNATTDSCAKPITKVREISPVTQQQQNREQSTNPKQFTSDHKNITKQLIKSSVAETTCSSSSTLNPSPSILSTLSTFSSSSSTSDASSSSSSSSSTSPASNIDTTDSSSSSIPSSVHLMHVPQIDPQDSTVSGQCPIAVFGDNDITLTKNSVNEALVSAAAVSRGEGTSNVPTVDDSTVPLTQHQRARKVSWIANPTAVDKLLTLFHNPFQRSSSPESKVTIPGTSVTSGTPGSMTSDSSGFEQQQLQSVSQKCLIPLRKQSPPSWSKLGTDILNAAGSNNINIELANAVTTTAAAVVTEQSRSFLDAASKQIRDFSKQVFRQNISFGNEAVTTASTTTITSSTVNNPNSGMGAEDISEAVGSSETISVWRAGVVTSTADTGSYPHISSVDCNVGSLPTEVKQEIKENISPEHTINEETLHSIQKLSGGTAASSGSAMVMEPATDNEEMLKASAWDKQTCFESN